MQPLRDFGFNRFPFLLQFKPDVEVLQPFFIAMEFFDDFAEASALLQDLLRLLLVLPEIFGADYRFELRKLLLPVIDFKDNLGGERFFP